MRGRRLIGTREFYRSTLRIAVPIMIQNGITNVVSMLDNIMVGQIGTNQMTGVSIVNQLIFVYNLMIFGGLAGIGIFTAQFFGKGDEEGVRYTVRIKVLMAAVLTVLALAVLLAGGDGLVSLWLKGSSGSSSGSTDAGETLRAAHSYLLVMCAGLLPFAATQLLSGTLRECGETLVPMKAGVAAVAVNLIGNTLLIYGLFGLPALGVVGAAIATVISRFVECALVYLWIVRNRGQVSFMTGIFRNFRLPASLAGKIIVRALPLLFNETLWSLSQTVLSQQYSLLGLHVVAACNIANTVNNVFNICFVAMGDAIAIILGQELGKGGEDGNVRLTADRLALFTVLISAASGAAMFLIAPLFPRIYNTAEEIRVIAAGLIRIVSVFMPLYAYENALYFILRSGGKTWVTLLFDSCFVWIVSIPLCALLVHFTTWTILPVFFCVQAVEVVKAYIGYRLVRAGKWLNNLTEYAEA